MRKRNSIRGVVAVCAVVFLAVSAVAFWLVGSLWGDETHVDEKPSALHELPLDVQRVLPQEAQNVYRAWFWRMQTYEQFCRFDVRPELWEEVELWLMSHGAEDLKSGTEQGALPGWFRGENAPDWWLVPTGAELVSYNFTTRARDIEAVIWPERGRVWLKLRKR